MKLRKMQGEADGWATAVALRSGTGWDEDDNPFQLVEGESYYIQGDLDPNVFELKEEKPKPVKPKPEKIEEVE